MRGIALAALLALVAGCARRPAVAPPPVRDVRRAEQALGFEPTANFHRESGRDAYHVCYAAGRFELPETYRGLQVDQGKKGSCRFDPEELDVFVYPAEALAGRSAPVTTSLAAAEPQRRDFVVAHEDFHEQPGVRRLEPGLKEAVSMLAGFLAAAKAAEIRGDPDGAEQALREVDLFLEKSRLVNAAHEELRGVYDAHARGALSAAEALARKAEAFDRLARQCSSRIEGVRAFHPCPAALNNAGLAFDATYTREYPRAHAIFVEAGRDPKTAIDALKALAQTAGLD